MGLRKANTAPHELEILVHWDQFDPEDATWEVAAIFNERYPDFHLEDKVKLWRAGIDRPPEGV